MYYINNDLKPQRQHSPYHCNTIKKNILETITTPSNYFNHDNIISITI